jgi:zinc protease
LPVQPDNAAATLAVPDVSRVQDKVYLAQDLSLKRTDPDYYALQLGNATLAGGFYASRLSVDLRKTRGLVYSVGSQIESGRTRSAYIIEYACDPQNVSKAAAIATEDIRNMQVAAVSEEQLARAKAILIRQMPLKESSIDEIAQALAQRRDLGLPLDEPTLAAHRMIALMPADVEAAFKKWIRPNDLVRASQGPAPQ